MNFVFFKPPISLLEAELSIVEVKSSKSPKFEIFENSLMMAMTTCFTEATRLLESSGSSVCVWQEEEERLRLHSLRCFGKSRKQMNPPPFLRNPPLFWETVRGPEKRPSQGPKNDQNDPGKKILALTHIDNPFFAKNGIQFGIFWPRQVHF